MTDVGAVYPAGRIAVRDAGLRNGLQFRRTWSSAAKKIERIEMDRAAGLRFFVVGSFLPADKVPRFADVREIMAAINRLGGFRITSTL